MRLPSSDGPSSGEDVTKGTLQRGDVRGENTSVWQLQNCPICGAAGTSLAYDELPDRLLDDPEPLRFTLRRCERCDLLLQSPRPKDLDRFYVGYPSHAPVRRPKWVGFLLRLWDLPRESRLRSILGKRASILEIGCGTGANSGVLTRRPGWRYRGLEPSARAVELARDRGLEAGQGDVGKLAELDGPFDLVFMQHVFEHLPEPVKVLERIAGKLSASGVVMLIVPNHRSLEHWLFRRYWIGLDQPRHLWVFSPRSLEKLLEAAGFTARSLSHSARPSGFIASFEFIVRSRWPRFRFPLWARRLLLLALAPAGIVAAAVRRSAEIEIVASPTLGGLQGTSPRASSKPAHSRTTATGGDV